MIDIRIIRERPDEVKHALDLLNTSAPIDRIVELDAERRRLVTEVEQLKATRNEGSKAVSKAKDPDERNRLIAEMKQVSDAITVMDAQITAVDGEFNDLMLQVPNMPMPEVPVGKDDSENVVVRTVGENRELRLRAEAALGARRDARHHRLRARREDLRLALLRAQGAGRAAAARADHLDARPAHREARLQRGLPALHGHAETLVGTGNLPKFGDNLYHGRRRGSLADPDRRGAGHQSLSRRDPRRRRSCRSTTSPTRPASAASRCRPAATCAASSAATSSTRSRWSSSSTRINRAPSTSR